jgi:hypothetical protein
MRFLFSAAPRSSLPVYMLLKAWGMFARPIGVHAAQEMSNLLSQYLLAWAGRTATWSGHQSRHPLPGFTSHLNSEKFS